MITSITELLKPVSQAEAMQTMARFLALVGFPVDAWQPGGAARTMLEAVADIVAGVTTNISSIASSAHLDTASGVWLDVCGRGRYDEARKPAVYTEGVVAFTDAGGVGPVSIDAPGDIVMRGAGVEFVSIGTGTIPLNGTLDVAVKARNPGPTTVLTGQITQLVTDIPGVTISNGPTWLTRGGAPAESDADYRLRCRLKWDKDSAGGTKEYYAYRALQSHPDVRRVRVLPNLTYLGSVRVIVAGAAGPLGPDAYAAARLAIESTYAPLAVDVTCVNALAYTVYLVGEVEVKSARPEAFGEGLANCANLLAGLGLDEPLRLAAIVEQLMLPQGAVNVRLTSPGSDFTHGNDDVFVIDTSGLTRVLV